MALISFLTNPTTIVEIATLVTAVITLRDKKCGYWGLFIPYIAIVLAVEIAGYYLRINGKANFPVYNFLLILSVSFFSYLFYRFAETKTDKRIVLAFFLAFVIFYLGESIWLHFAERNRNSRWLAGFIIVFFCCHFYYCLLKTDSIKNPLRFPPFWIVTGLLFFYLGSTSMFAFYDQISQIKLRGGIYFYDVVMGCINIIFYGCWIIGFVWKKEQL